MLPKVGTHIGRYEILSVIGTGGMGEVFLARDSQLNRHVAIKVLRTAYDRERLMRFRQEAQATSALNHPNILTIFEFGEHHELHYIVSEFVSGETLRQKISENRISLDEVLEIAIQIGNALAVAHNAGVVHRDIKPENIMILPDGYVKVLDFGLAKLTGLQGSLSTDPDLATVSLLETRIGMIIGTVAYMSPEQLRGQPVNGQADIWGLGVVLYEMICGQRPFPGDSVSDIIAAVLERSLPPLPGTAIPNEVESIVVTALKKDKGERYTTVHEFVLALKRARLSMNPSGSGESLPRPRGLADKASTSVDREVRTDTHLGSRAGFDKRRTVLVLAVLLALVGIGAWTLGTPGIWINSPTAKQITSRQLSVMGNIVNAVISPSGHFVAYTQSIDGKQSLWLRLLDETAGDGTKLGQLDIGRFGSLSFTPDSKWLYYSVFNEHAVGTLNKIPITGGPAQQIVDNIDSSATFSPDGDRFTFLSRNTVAGTERVVVSDADGHNPETVVEKKLPDFFSVSNREGGLAWIENGKSIVSPVHNSRDGGGQMGLVEIDAKTGTENELNGTKWPQIGKVIAANGQRDLFITADTGKGLFQVFRIMSDGSDAKKIGDDLSDYKNISISADGKLLVAVKNDRISNFFRASSDLGNIVQIARNSTDSLGGLAFLPDGRLIYVSVAKGSRDIWRMDADGNNPEPLTFDNTAEDYPSVSADGRYIVFVSTRDGVPHIWRMDIDGRNQKQLTHQSGETFPQIANDGQWVIYSSKIENHFALWRVSIDGGESERLTKGEAHWASMSPDGKTVACLARIKNPLTSPDQDVQVRLAIVSAVDGRVLKSFTADKVEMSPEFPPVLRWRPDGRSLTYISTFKGVSNIWSQSLAGGDPQKLTDFSSDRIFTFDWSIDGKQLVFARGSIRTDIVLFESF